MSKLASDPIPGSERPEPVGSVPTSEIYSWASQLAAESRDPLLRSKFYVWPKPLIGMSQRLRRTKGGIFCIVGLQGVGKSSALVALEATEKIAQESHQVILLKWRKERCLLKSLLNGSHELSSVFLRDLRNLVEDPDFYFQMNTNALSVGPFNSASGKFELKELYRSAWLNILRRMMLILIDMPDYSKTDKRAMTTDLQDVYWLWNDLVKGSVWRPNLVIAVQKEMFAGHFFFDKMEKVELEPLQPIRCLRPI